MRAAVGDRCDLLFGTHGQFTDSGRDPARAADRALRAALVRGAGAARNARADGAGGARDPIPIAAGERLTTKYEFARVLATGAASILQMDLGRVGGLLEAKKIAGMAEAHYAQIAPHLYCGPGRRRRQHPARRLQPEFPHPREHRALGRLPRRDPQEADPLGGRLCHPADEPGLGVELDEAVALAHPYRGTELHLVPTFGPVAPGD